MLEAAELGALAAVDAGLVGAERMRRGAARDQVLLAGEVRHPEAVDHVVGVQRDDDRAGRPARGSRWRCRTIARRVGVVVAHLPPPLVAGDLERAARPRAACRASARSVTTLATSSTSRQHRRRDDRDEHAALRPALAARRPCDRSARRRRVARAARATARCTSATSTATNTDACRRRAMHVPAGRRCARACGAARDAATSERSGCSAPRTASAARRSDARLPAASARAAAAARGSRGSARRIACGRSRRGRDVLAAASPLSERT